MLGCRVDIRLSPRFAAGCATALVLAGCASGGDSRRPTLIDELGSLSSRLEVYERMTTEDHEERVTALNQLEQSIERAGVRQQRVIRSLGSPSAGVPGPASGTVAAPPTSTRGPSGLAPPLTDEPAEKPAVPDEDARSVALFRNAYTAYQRSEYRMARDGFKSALEAAQSDSQRCRCLYWIGQSNYVQKNWEQAIAGFRTLREEYPESQLATSALLKEGFALLEQGDAALGEAVLRRLIETYPDAIETPLARERLSDLSPS